LRKYYNHEDAFKFNAKIFKNIDVNNSKTIEYGEFRVCGMEIEYNFIVAKLTGMFKLLDKDNDKKITIEEIVKSINDTGDSSSASKLEDLDYTNVKNEVVIDRKE